VTVRIVLADDEHLVRAGLRTVLEREPDLEVVAEAGDGAAAVQAVRQSRPDVALLDVRMPGVDGIEATRRLTDDPAVSARVVVLTTFDDDELLVRALRAGAQGYLLKSMPAPQLAAGVRTAAVGDVLLAPLLTQRLIDRHLQGSDRAAQAADVLDRLSPREQDVLRLVGRGMSNEEVAAALFIAPATVKTHVSALLDKLGARDRLQLVVQAYETGVLQPGS
jgi:DNA-binding NarL/FixJ family response regulator